MTHRSTTPEQWAHKLEALTGGAMHVYFDPKSRLVSDPKSEGHLYVGHINPSGPDGEADFVSLDDRKGSLVRQLADELHRIADLYRGYADRVGATLSKYKRPVDE